MASLDEGYSKDVAVADMATSAPSGERQLAIDTCCVFGGLEEERSDIKAVTSI